MRTMPGFTPEASLDRRSATSWGGEPAHVATEGVVVPAVDCLGHCMVKLIDCTQAHEKNCLDRYRMCKFWCLVGSLS